MEVVFICNCHRMKLKFIKSTNFNLGYRCPKYLKINRREDEKACKTSMTVFDVDTITNKILGMRFNNELNIGDEFSYRDFVFCVQNLKDDFVMLLIQKGGEINENDL